MGIEYPRKYGGERDTDFFKPAKLAIVWSVVAVVVMVLVFGTFRIVPAGSRGVLLNFGEAVEIRNEGLNFKIPIVQSIVKMSVQTQKYEALATAASKDLQDVRTNVALNYHLSPDSVLSTYRDLSIDYSDRVINPAVQEVVKAVTAGFTAEELITKRPFVKDKIDMTLAERLNKYGIVVETVSITEFAFSEEFNRAIEAKVTAQQQALKAENDLTRIRVEAEQQIASAQAEAEGYRLINEQLKSSPAALQAKWIEKWDGNLPQVVTSDNSGMMFMVNTQNT